MLTWLEIAGAALFALSGAALIVITLARWTQAPAGAPLGGGPAVFLFEGQRLVDATRAARRLLPAVPAPGGRELSGLLALLSRGFGADLEARVAALPAAGQLLLASDRGAGTLEAETEGGALRLTIRPEKEDAAAGLDRLALEAAREELELLRGLAEDAPQPIWTLDAAGALSWANRAYLALSDQVRALSRPGARPGRAAGLRAAWPAASVFASPSDLAEGEVRRRRQPLPLPQGRDPLWFDVTSVRRGSGTLHFAADVGDLVLAESARLHFVQTLAKTFAHLATGLAIFDRQRRLALFNPAFMDLTGLSADFLSGRPLVHTVLDRLREAKILPEPRDYASWREELAALEAAASEGVYSDTWALPTGETYRVTGRPHPDGAIAFLFEDISGEVGLTRRFRTELDTLGAALDALDEAVAVFGATGALQLANAAYIRLWGASPPDGGPTRGSVEGPSDGPLGGPGDLAAERMRWEAACAPGWPWAEIASDEEGLPLGEGELRHSDGRLIRLRTVALPDRGRLVSFRVEAPERSRRPGPPGSLARPTGPAKAGRVPKATRRQRAAEVAGE